MRKRYISAFLGVAMAAVAMAAAVSAPAEVLDNLEFFSDFELLSNLEILEDESEKMVGIAVSTDVVVSTAAVTSVPISSHTVGVSTFTRRSYEKR